ncbi:MAG: hypothetical protein H6Q58_2182 [Firmicutes bacterium]|nr:hypothetical protein [Bacillota bacterium]
MDNKTYRKFVRVCGAILVFSGFLLLFSYFRTMSDFMLLLLGIMAAGFGAYLFKKYK